VRGDLFDNPLALSIYAVTVALVSGPEVLQFRVAFAAGSGFAILVFMFVIPFQIFAQRYNSRARASSRPVDSGAGRLVDGGYRADAGSQVDSSYQSLRASRG